MQVWKMKLQIGLMALLAMSGYSSADVLYSLTTAGSSVTINGGVFTQGSVQPSGTGVIDPFLRVQASPTEFGYNTDGTPVLDDKGGIWTHSVLLSNIPVVTYQGKTYYQFLLDIAEPQSGTRGLLSLDVLKFYTGTTPTPVCCPGSSSDFGNAWWDIDSASVNNYILLDSGLSTGNGSSDMYALIPTSSFDGNTRPYLYMYSGFGVNNSSEGSFEEWAYFSSPTTPNPPPATVPEPASLVLMGSGMFTGATVLRRRLNKK